MASLASAEFTYTDDGTSITITGYAPSPVGDLLIPETINEKPVTGIGNNAFYYCTGLTSVTIPAGVTSIGNNAFYYCTGLTNVTIPSSVTSIGSYAFYNSTLLTSVQLPSTLAGISVGMFWNCSGLTSLEIPVSVTTIGDNAFKGCSGLTNINLPTNVTSIGVGAFANCGGLTSLVIPPNITNIQSGTFSSCSGLTELTLPSAVNTIGSFAFQYCRGLTSIHIPANVTSIHTNKVFDSCSSLVSISVDPANPNYSSVDGYLTNKSQSTLITCPAGKSGGISLPASVTGIGASAFLNCAKITGVTIPSNVTSIGTKAFSTCGALKNAVFTGNAPAAMITSAFELSATGFAVYYLDGATGFTQPWYGYTTVNMGANGTPFSSWLISKAMPANSALMSDGNGDGVNLLMAYALNLDPSRNLSGAMPQAVLATDQMSLSFYSGSAGVSYVVEASSDMQNWSTDGVTLSSPDANQIRTATVNLAGASGFMRLVVGY